MNLTLESVGISEDEYQQWYNKTKSESDTDRLYNLLALIKQVIPTLKYIGDSKHDQLELLKIAYVCELERLIDNEEKL